MTPRYACLAWILLGTPLGPLALAQQSAGAPVELPRPQDIDPAVDTSASTAAKGPAGAAPGSPAASAAAADASAATAAPSSGATKAGRTKSTASVSASAAGPKSAGKALDRLELDTTQITGNRELPKVLYIVPWKHSDLGDLPGRPANSLLDEVLAPVDRDVFQRENRYYNALKPDAARAAAEAGGRGTETGAAPAVAPPAAP